MVFDDEGKNLAAQIGDKIWFWDIERGKMNGMPMPGMYIDFNFDIGELSGYSEKQLLWWRLMPVNVEFWKLSTLTLASILQEIAQNRKAADKPSKLALWEKFQALDPRVQQLLESSGIQAPPKPWRGWRVELGWGKPVDVDTNKSEQEK